MGEDDRGRASLAPSKATKPPKLRRFELSPVNDDHWRPRKRDTEAKYIKHCHSSLVDALDCLSESYDRVSKVDIARLAHVFGSRRLWMFPGVKELRDLRQYIRKHGDADDKHWVRERTFEGLRTGDHSSTTLDLYTATIRQCAKFAKAVGIHEGHAHQLGMMCALLEAEEVPPIDRKTMRAILRQFKSWISERIVKAQEIQRTIELREPEPEVDTSGFSFERLLIDD